jgi:hypothetical protein
MVIELILMCIKIIHSRRVVVEENDLKAVKISQVK